MKTIFLIFILIGSVLSVKENLLKQNKIHKQQNVKHMDFNSVCDECQAVVTRFTNAAKDPSKMSNMKDMLFELCYETSYEEECQVLVSKMDIFTAKFMSYLQNPKSVCTTFNMCSNSGIDQFNRIGLLFAKRFLSKVDGANDLICEECRFSASGLLEIVDDKATQVQVQNLISGNVCAHLGQYKRTCDAIIKDFLPSLFQESHSMLSNDKQFCVDLKLCSTKEVNLNHRLNANDLKSKLMGPKHVQNLLKKIQSLKAIEPHNLAVSCMECQILADILLDELKTDDAINLLADVLQKGLCFLLPEEFGCDDFVSIYGTTVVYMTVEQFDSESLCEAMIMCTNDTSTQLSKYSKKEKSALRSMKCSGCEQLSNFLTVEMSQPKSKSELIYGLQHMICKEAPQSLYNICDKFVGGLLPQAYDKFLHSLQNNILCQNIHAC